MAGAVETRLSVACVHVSAQLGGSEWSLLDFARRAAAHAIDAIVVLPKEGPLADALRQAGVRTAIARAPEDFLELSQRRMVTVEGAFVLLRGLYQWSRAIAAELAHAEAAGALKAQVLYSNGFKAHLVCALLFGPRRVWHLREFPPEKFRVAWRALGGTLPHGAVANSQAVADAWRFGGLTSPVVVHNGVDLDRFHPAPRTGWIHGQLDIPSGARLIGMPAVFARWKGHLQVVEAFERVAEELPDVHLVLVGAAIYDTSAERGYAEELVRRVGRASLPGRQTQPLNDRIHFLKFHAEPWRLYPEFDVVVHFSTRPEPFGRVVAESLASGVPAIAAAAGGPLEILEPGVTGWLVPPGDVGALAAQLVASLGADRSAMGAACRRAAEERFSADRYAAEVAHALRAVATPSAPPR